MKIHVVYDDRLLSWKGSPSDPVRAKNAIDLLEAGGADLDVQAIDGAPAYGDLTFVHDVRYVRQVLDGYSSEWRGRDFGQAGVASLMFQGTVQLTRQLLDADRRQPWLGFSPQGAKHHAQWNHSEGFCVFNDFAWAARTLSARGLKVLYLDFDVHHGDGVEALTYHDDRIMTASIHEWGIFPGTGKYDCRQQNVWNWPLEAESGDDEFTAAVTEVFDVANATGFVPDVALVAAGADAHADDPMSSLGYTLDGYVHVAATIAQRLSRVGCRRVLVGGAGGYLPHDVTPTVWATVVSTLANELERLHENDVHDVAKVIQ